MATGSGVALSLLVGFLVATNRIWCVVSNAYTISPVTFTIRSDVVTAFLQPPCHSEESRGKTDSMGGECGHSCGTKTHKDKETGSSFDVRAMWQAS